jgi:hypothetical protein
MDPKLERYVARIFSLLHSHWLIADSHFEFLQPDDSTLGISGRAVTIDGSRLYITENTEVELGELRTVDYSYQFRNPDELGFFRYDSASHGRPDPYHHKHEHGKPTRPVEAPPTVLDFLREVENTLAAKR